MTQKKASTVFGCTLILCAAALCGMIFAGLVPPCETRAWEDILLLLGSWCTLSKGWGYIVYGQDLPTKRPSVYDPPGPPL